MSFRLEKHAETFISPASIYKNIVSKAIRYLLCHFHDRRVVKAIRYIIYTETMHDKYGNKPTIRYGFQDAAIVNCLMRTKSKGASKRSLNVL